jgi:hypothetical protein
MDGAWLRSWCQVTRMTCQPSAIRRLSRSRSLSNAWRVPCVARPSSSTINRSRCQRQSTQTNRPATKTSALNLGRGRPCESNNGTKSSSKSFPVTPPTSAPSPSKSRSTTVPRRRGYRPSRSGIDSRSVKPCTSTWFSTRSTCRRGARTAKSKTVRGTVVTGIPSTTVRSSAGSRDRCEQISGWERRYVGLVTSDRCLERETSPQSWAALRWLSTASGPPASTAAIQRLSIRETG